MRLLRKRRRFQLCRLRVPSPRGRHSSAVVRDGAMLPLCKFSGRWQSWGRSAFLQSALFSSPSPQFKAVLTDPGKGHLTSFLTREAIHMRCPLGAPCGQGLRFLHPSMPQTWHREARAPNTLAWELILSHLSSRQSTPSQAQGPSSIYHHVLLCSLPFSLHYCP